MPLDMAKAREDYARDGVVKLPGVLDVQGSNVPEAALTTPLPKGEGGAHGRRPVGG